MHAPATFHAASQATIRRPTAATECDDDSIEERQADLLEPRILPLLGLVGPESFGATVDFVTFPAHEAEQRGASRFA